MTILEINLLSTLKAIEAEKAGRNIEPCHTLIIKDNLRERVEQAIGMPVLPEELTNALEWLYLDGYIHLGNTINDTYAKVIFHNEQRQ